MTTAANGEILLYDPERRCPKCGHDDVFTSYEPNSHGYACMGHSKGFSSLGDGCEVCADEHFHRGCRRCQHKWREELNPAPNGRDRP